MSENTKLTAVQITSGNNAIHAAAGDFTGLSAPNPRGMVYARPICGLRGRDSSGFPTVRLFGGVRGIVPFDPSSDESRDFCPKCVKLAEKIRGGMSLRDATVVHAPKMTQKVKDEVERSTGTPLSFTVLSDITVIDNISGRSGRTVKVSVESAPYRVFTSHVIEYPEEVTLPSKLERVNFYVEGGEVRAAGRARAFHPKTMKPVVGKKLPWSDSVNMEHEDVAALAKLLGL